MGLQEFPSKPVNKGGVIVGTVNGPTEVAIGAQNSYLVADSTTTPGAKWQTYRKYNTVQLTSGTSWTVPATVEQLDVLLIGGGGAGTTDTANTTAGNFQSSTRGNGGAIVYVPGYAVTPGAAITYSIGAGSTAPAASGAANTRTYPSGAGNTTFGTLIAPGAMNKIGNANAWVIGTQSGLRGVFDYNAYDGPSGTSNSTLTAWTTNTLAPLANTFHTEWGHYVAGHWATATNSAGEFTSPSNYLSNGPNQINRGFPKGVTRLLADYTEPVGSQATNEITTNSGVRLGGWGGTGGGSASTTTNPTYSYTPYGGGQGVILNSGNTTGRSFTAANAAANSGAGGGSSRCCSSGATPIQAAISGNGGSGVIFIGYWA